jgi:hypothetical protein
MNALMIPMVPKAHGGSQIVNDSGQTAIKGESKKTSRVSLNYALSYLGRKVSQSFGFVGKLYSVIRNLRS